MSINYINTGSSPNAGDGDSLRTAFTKINQNFGYLSTLTNGGGSGSGSPGPQGPTGPQGVHGPTGPQGSPSSTGNISFTNNTIFENNSGPIFIQTGSTNTNWWTVYNEFKFNGATYNQGIAYDSTGNVYMMEGPGYCSSVIVVPAILAKFDPTGTKLWDYHLTPTPAQSFPYTYGSGFWINSSNSIYVASVVDNAGKMLYLANLDTNGQLISSQLYTLGTSFSGLTLIDVQGDNSDNLYVLLSCSDTQFAVIKIMASTLAASNAVLVNLSGNQTIQVSELSSSVNGVAVSGSYVNGGNTSAFVINLDYDFYLQWARQLDGGQTAAYSIQQDSGTNIYLAGMSNSNNNGSFVSKYDSAGNLMWQRQVDAQNETLLQDLVVDDTSVYISGISYDGVNTTTNTYASIFLQKLNPTTGQTVWQNEWSSTIGDVYQLPGEVNFGRGLAVNQNKIAVSAFTNISTNPYQETNNVAGFLAHLPKDGSLANNQFINFEYLSTNWSNTTGTLTNSILSAVVLSALSVTPTTTSTVITWAEEENDAPNPIFDSIAYPLASTFEFGTDNNIHLPPGGDIVDSNGNSITGKYIGWQTPNNTEWSIVTESGGTSIYYHTTTSVVSWWDPAAIATNLGQFRGATIDYHATVNGGNTRIGQIIWSRDATNDVTITHTESGGSIFDEYWVPTTDGGGHLAVIGYRNNQSAGNTVMIQWTAKMYYGAEWGC